MSGLRRTERWVLAVLLPVWLAAAVLFVHERLLRGTPAHSPLLVEGAVSPATLPRVVGLRPGFRGDADGLAPGDLLAAVGSQDVRGMGSVAVLAHSYAEAAEDGSLAVAWERGGERHPGVIRIEPMRRPWIALLVAMGFAATAVLVVLRVPQSRLAQTFLPASLVWTLTILEFQGASVLQTELYIGLRALCGCFWAPLLLRSALVLPEEVAPVGRPLPRWPWLAVALGPTWTSMWFGVPLSSDVGMRLNPALGVAVLVTLLAVITRNYRRAGPVGRRQVKWVVTGVYLGVTPVVAAAIAAALRPELQPLWSLSYAALLVIPVFIFLAITRSHLLDIDGVISTSATWTLLLVASVTGAGAAAPALGQAVAHRAGVPEAAGEAGVSLVIALLALRGATYLRPRLERLLFAERHALRTGIARLVRELARAPDVETLAQVTGGRLDEILRPRCCVLYGRGEKAFEPLFVRGVRVAPAFDVEGEVARVLTASAPEATFGPDAPAFSGLPSGERMALATLGAELIVPVLRGDVLAALLCLGRKRSGDIYTSTDRALLLVVASQLSVQLLRFGGQELLAESHSMQERLRRWVPGSVASELARGRELDPVEREVSVLFVDIRGYASFAEGRPAAEIFSTVNRYTQAVSRAVRDHGGTVVEFNGDGMMAVFGAPEPLADKERCAVAAARQIAQTMTALSAAADAALRVGVGIATGAAYVGAIHSVDRWIWSAIGNTTNLAARLQGLARDLDVDVVIDDPTRRRAGAFAHGAELHPRLAIRGLRDAHDVYALRVTGTTAPFDTAET